MIDKRSEQINAIKNQLNTLKDHELGELAHILSLYQDQTVSEDHPSAVPMHFLGRFLGITQNQDGTSEMKLGLQNANTYGVAQGGAIYILADVAIGFSILQDVEEGQKVLTLELKVNFIEKGQGSRLIASPIILRRGRSTVVSECTVTDEQGNLVAKALGTFYITSSRKVREEETS
ncbi:PaaI family thioesterase [Planococcus glaciei]|uniref:PaaI family thioesterase n=1 Tax=Planococcus glaciei TaxID=459472 RepID=UPI001C72D7AA|nr:PaaI family thioesterase [Planococcus glaciei]MBX0314432.1 PaaI family thioesterase [Planococcus glaciei]